MEDLYELMTFLCKITEQDLSDYEIEKIFYDKYGIDEEQFQDLLIDLLPLCEIGTSPLTGKNYRGFADIKNNCWLMKQEV